MDYVHYTTYYPYSDPSYGPGYGSGYGFGLTRVGFAGRHHRHGGRSFVFFGSRFYDPFFYSYIPYSVSIQGGHFRQRQGYVLPIPGTELEGIKKFCGISPTDKSVSPNQWLTRIFEVSSRFLNKRTN